MYHPLTACFNQNVRSLWLVGLSPHLSTRINIKEVIPMSQHEKELTDSALAALTKLAESKGAEYVSGLVDGINLSTPSAPSTGSDA